MAQAKKIEALEEQLGSMGSEFSAFKDTMSGLEGRIEDRLEGRFSSMDGRFSSMDDRFTALETLLRSMAEQRTTDQRVVTTAGPSTSTAAGPLQDPTLTDSLPSGGIAAVSANSAGASTRDTLAPARMQSTPLQVGHSRPVAGPPTIILT